LNQADRSENDLTTVLRLRSGDWVACASGALFVLLYAQAFSLEHVLLTAGAFAFLGIHAIVPDFVLDERGITRRGALLFATHIGWNEARRLRVHKQLGCLGLHLMAGPKRIVVYEQYEHFLTVSRLVLGRVGPQCQLDDQAHSLMDVATRPRARWVAQMAALLARLFAWLALVTVAFGFMRALVCGGVCWWAQGGCVLGLLAGWIFLFSDISSVNTRANVEANLSLLVGLLGSGLCMFVGAIADAGVLRTGTLLALGAIVGLLVLHWPRNPGRSRARLALVAAIGLGATLSLADRALLQRGTWIASLEGLRELGVCAFTPETGGRLVGATYSAYSRKGRVFELEYVDPNQGKSRVFSEACLGASVLYGGRDKPLLILTTYRSSPGRLWLAGPTLSPLPTPIPLGKGSEGHDLYGWSPDGSQALLQDCACKNEQLVTVLDVIARKTRKASISADRSLLGWADPEGLWVYWRRAKDGKPTRKYDQPGQVALERIDLLTGQAREVLASTEECLSVRRTSQPGVLIAMYDDRIEVMDGPARRLYEWPLELPVGDYRVATLADAPVAVCTVNGTRPSLVRFDWRKGSSQVLWEAPAGALLSQPSISPGGKHVAVVVERRRLWGIEHSRRLAVLAVGSANPDAHWTPLYGWHDNIHSWGSDHLSQDFWLDDDHVMLLKDRFDWKSVRPTLNYQKPLRAVRIRALRVTE
jgi:hypothetical protein